MGNKMRTLARLQHNGLQNGAHSGDLQLKASQDRLYVNRGDDRGRYYRYFGSIAMPAYTDHVRRGKATEATSELANARARMEQYFQDSPTYVGAPCPVAGQNFTYTCVSDATTYTITASGGGDMSNFSFTINDANFKTSIFDGTAGDCWLTKKGGTC